MFKPCSISRYFLTCFHVVWGDPQHQQVGITQKLQAVLMHWAQGHLSCATASGNHSQRILCHCNRSWKTEIAPCSAKCSLLTLPHVLLPCTWLRSHRKENNWVWLLVSREDLGWKAEHWWGTEVFYADLQKNQFLGPQDVTRLRHAITFNCATPFRANGSINLHTSSKMCPAGSVSLTWASVVSPLPPFTICYGAIIAMQHSSEWFSKEMSLRGHAEDKRELPIWEVSDRLVNLSVEGRLHLYTCIAQSSHAVTVVSLISSHSSSVVAHKIRHIKTRETDWSLAIRLRIDKWLNLAVTHWRQKFLKSQFLTRLQHCFAFLMMSYGIFLSKISHPRKADHCWKSMWCFIDWPLTRKYLIQQASKPSWRAAFGRTGFQFWPSRLTASNPEEGWSFKQVCWLPQLEDTTGPVLLLLHAVFELAERRFLVPMPSLFSYHFCGPMPSSPGTGLTICPAQGMLILTLSPHGTSCISRVNFK